MPADLPDDAPPGVPLSDMIETVRSELQRSLQRGAGQAVSFDIDKVELELKVLVGAKAKAEASGGVALWVVSKIGAGVELQRDRTHTFKLTLSPVMAATGARTRIKADVDADDRPGER